MRHRIPSILMVAILGVAACQPAAAPSASAPASSGAATATPAGSSAPPSASGGTAADTLQMHWLGDVTAIWHPASYETFSQAINFELMFSNLIDQCWEGDVRAPCADLADSWDTADGLTYTFKLAPGITWHDGTPFTANDVAWTINRSYINKPIRFKNTAWEALVGADEVIAGTATEATGVKVVDDNTIELTIKEANVDWLSDVAEPEGAILPMHILKDTDPTTVETMPFSTTSPIGTGPYKFIKYETDQYTQFEAFPEYFRGTPGIKNIFVKRLLGDLAIAQLESGDLDLSVRLNPAEKSRLESVATLDVLSTPGVGTFGPYFNMLRMTDINCRKAVGYAFNAQGVIDSIYGGAGRVNRGVLPGMPAADDQEFIDYDQAKATQLFNDCNATDNWTKDQPLRIVFDKSFAGVEQWVPIFAQDLEAVGFKTELNGLESTAAIELYNKIDQWEILIAQGGDQGVGPFKTESYFDCEQNEPAVWQAYLKDCEINKLYAQARKELDETKRTEIFKQISSRINKGFDRVSFWTTNALSAKVKGLQGVQIPPNTREFITGAYKWTLTK
jgi:peptide/nickel transport system substrate-binding protein